MKITLLTIVLIAAGFYAKAQMTSSHADSLRGSITKERAWWDLLHYDLHASFNPADSSISGHNAVRYKIIKSSDRMQIDLMKPMEIDSIIQLNTRLSFERDGNAFFVQLRSPQTVNTINSILIYFHGKPAIAVRPPWDGGAIWTKDKQGRPWITIACQGLGASVWFPCKDHQYDEPDSVSLSIHAPEGLAVVANGRMVDEHKWMVRNPINNYNIIPYIGYYQSSGDKYNGEKGPLDVNYRLLDYTSAAEKEHLKANVVKTLKHLEHWFGPYPFYEDGYSIVEAPHLGMEHQSAIAYGNHFQNGYLGHDLSGSGWGLKWDFIVVHESAHEWFGNNITTKDIADMWVHESFANYSETLFTTSEFGVEAGNDYVIGSRRHIQNDTPIIGPYNVNREGSGDMYYKGGNMLHMIRQVINDDEKFRQILRGLTRQFYHQTVTSADIENYISRQAGIDFSKVFQQYLRTTQIPVLTYSVKTEKGNTIVQYFWANCVPGFDMPVKVSFAHGKTSWLKPVTSVQKIKVPLGVLPEKIVDRNFYVGEQKQ